jgi:hypothetical protein
MGSKTLKKEKRKRKNKDRGEKKEGDERGR